MNTAKKSPMKSIVMINAGRPPSAASIVSSSSSSTATAAFDLMAQQRNMTPVAGCCADEQQQAPRQQFKTCVNIGGTVAKTTAVNEVSNVIVASPATPIKLSKDSASKHKPLLDRVSNRPNASGKLASTTTTTSKTGDFTNKPTAAGRQADLISSGKQQFSETSLAFEETPEQQQRQQKQHSSVASTSGEQHFLDTQLRRSTRRSSLRRRPSFSGSCKSISKAGEPRPSSPVPRPLGGSGSLIEAQQRQASSSSETVRMGAAAATIGQQLGAASPAATSATTTGSQTNQKQQKQLQRALILAQKYNYSPAKLAASKLGSKLQLKEPTGKAGK